jgi:hypothetical protein
MSVWKAQLPKWKPEAWMEESRGDSNSFSSRREKLEMTEQYLGKFPLHCIKRWEIMGCVITAPPPG